MRIIPALPTALAVFGLAATTLAAPPSELTDGQKPLQVKATGPTDGLSDGQKPLAPGMSAPPRSMSDGQKPLTVGAFPPGDGSDTKGYAASDGDTSVHPLTLAIGPAQVSLTGLVQAQVAMFVGEDSLLATGAPAERVGVRLRRGRLGLAASLWDQLEVQVGFEADADGAQLLDANLAFAFMDEIGISAGFKKLPFSRFALISPGYQALADRPLGTQAMAPLHQLGIGLEGDIMNGALMYSVGAYNGFERNTNFHEGFAEPTATLGNRFSKMALGARLSTEPLGYLGPHVADLRTGDAKEAFLLGVGASFYYNGGSSTTGLGVEGDLAFKIYGLHLLAEVIWDSSSPVAQPTTGNTIVADLNRLSVAAEVGYTYAFERDPFHLGATVRVELLDDAMGHDDAGDALAVTGGVSFYWQRHHLKFNLEYQHRSESHGAALDNDAVLLQLSSAL